MQRTFSSFRRFLWRGFSSSSNHSLQAVCSKRRVVSIYTSDKLWHFPLAWLRDNCRCAQCFNTETMSRQVTMKQFNPAATPLTVDFSNDCMNIVWDDEHKSSYLLSWLTKLGFSDSTNFQTDPEIRKKEHVLWKSNPFEMKFFDYKKVLEDDVILHDCLVHLEQFGLVLLNNAGTAEDVITDLCSRMCHYPRRTHYGLTFRVESKDNPSNVAYTTGELGFHTDLPYFNDQPSIQALHCAVQTLNSGGVSVFSDGLSAAERLRKEYPDYFKVLSDADAYFRDKNMDDLDKFYLFNQHPIIELNSTGSVSRIHFSNQQRDSITCLSQDRIQLFYDALKTYNDLLYYPDCLVEHKMRNGEISVFVNGRVLHGRTAYSGRRLFYGAYMSWDEVLSRRRVLERKIFSSERNIKDKNVGYNQM